MTTLDPSKQGIEAQKLISISLGKMAASRVNKGGSSLHKSLLVASVLQRARNVFFEENYHNFHFRGPTLAPVPMYAPHVGPPCPPTPPANDENSLLVPQQETASAPKDEGLSRVPFSDASNQQNQRSVSLKRRRCVSDKETQDAVSSILPKRFRSSTVSEYGDSEMLRSSVASVEGSPIRESENALLSICASDNALLKATATTDTTLVCANKNAPEDVLCDSATATVNPIYCTLEPISDDEEEDDASSMEVEHITSLVSIFSFGAPRKDLCAAQAAREEPAQFTPLPLAV